MLNSDERDAWRKRAVKRDRKHEPLVEKLTVDKSETGRPIFSFKKDLMVFAAMIGYSKKRRSKISRDNISIILETYHKDDQDGFIYLIALMTKKDVTILKDQNLLDAIVIFEEYCNYGLEEIQLWLDENPGDIEAIDTLSEKIFDQVILNEEKYKDKVGSDQISVDF